MKVCKSLFACAAIVTAIALPAAAQQPQRPNIVFIMGDDIGVVQHRRLQSGMMAGRTPSLDKLASEGMRFTDYYAEASCTAGRANFITGELPIRTGSPRSDWLARRSVFLTKRPLLQPR
jgi:arylsulfatase